MATTTVRETKTVFFIFYPNEKLDATHSQRFGEQFEKICKSNGVSCKLIRGKYDISSCLKIGRDTRVCPLARKIKKETVDLDSLLFCTGRGNISGGL